MPRIAKRSYLERVRTKERAERANVQGRVRKNKFVDPFPWVHGTVPEKMVYAELSRRQIPFYFLNDFRYTLPELDLIKEYQNDFFIPSANLIIEVQGSYWHSKPEAIESDAFKFAVMQMSGRRVVGWWDFDIIARLHELFDEDPQLSSMSNILDAAGPFELSPVKRTKIDTSQGIRTLNRKRAQRVAYKKPSVRIRS